MSFLLVAQAITTAHQQQMAAGRLDVPTLVAAGLDELDRQEALRREWRGYAEQLADEPTRQHSADTCDIPACPLCQQLARDRAEEMQGDLRREQP